MTDDRDNEGPRGLEERVTRAGKRPGDRVVRIVRPPGGEFRRRGGHYVATTSALAARGRAGRWYQSARRVLFGERLTSEQEGEERLSKKTGLAIMASDNISSSAYATEEAMRVLALAGAGALALLSSLLLIKFEASVTNLIPLYTVGVFIAFTLSQAGMVRKWLRERTRGWLASAGINAVGAGATAVVAVVVMFVKFSEGAWLVALVLPLLVLMLYGINAHYRSVGDRLLIDTATPVRLRPTVPRVIVPISRIDRSSLRALAIARGLGGDVYAVHISYDADGAQAFKRRWLQVVGPDMPLDTIISPYRALMPPLLRYIDAVDRGDLGRPIIVVLAEFVPRHWWEALLHNQTALLLKLRLFMRRNTSVLDVPYHLDEADTDDDRRPG